MQLDIIYEIITIGSSPPDFMCYSVIFPFWESLHFEPLVSDADALLWL